jgi:signal recognition particle subunit SRP54
MAVATQNEDTAGLEKKLMSGQAMDLNDLAKQLRMMQRMGGMAGMLDLLPGMGAMKDKVAGTVDDKLLGRQLAIISSMTAKERKTPLILNAKRRVRIAKGSGTTVNDVNKLMKMHEGMAQMSKILKKGGLKGLMGAMGGKGMGHR